jgi:hypothetical protein
MEADNHKKATRNMGNSVYSTPIVAGDTLYIANKSHLFAIREGAKPTASAVAPPATK